MKKSLFTIAVSILLLVSFAMTASASETDNNTVVLDDGTTIINYDDGSYTIISTPEALVLPVQPLAATHDVSGKINATNYSKKGEVNWIYTLIGYFTYEEGVSCVCTNSTYEVSITGSGWKFYDPSNTWSENAAYGYGVFKHKFAFITNNTTTVDLRIRCDNYGNFY